MATLYVSRRHNIQPGFLPCRCCYKQRSEIYFEDKITKYSLQLCLLQGRLHSQDSGKHLHDVLDLLQKHTLVEADISAQAERIKAVQGAAQRFTSYEQGESNMLLHIVSADHPALV